MIGSIKYEKCDVYLLGLLCNGSYDLGIIIFQKIVVAPVTNLQFKQNKTIDVWKNMTISELADATGIPVGKL